MKRLLSALIAAFVLAGAASTVSQAGTMMHGSKHMHHSCPAGQTWVHGYTKKDGTKVKGYCRK